MTPFPGITAPSYQLASSKAETELSINCFRERIENGEGVGQFALNKSPGLNSNGALTAIAVAPVRGMLELNDHLFVAVGGLVGDYMSSYVVTAYGNIADDGRPVQMAASQTSLVFIAAGVLYRINGGALTTPVVPFAPVSIAFGKNYFIALSVTGNQFYWSTDDGATWLAGNVQTAEAQANAMVRAEFINQLLCLIGTRITQWFSVGTNPNAPFVPIDSGVMRSGTESATSVAKLGGSLIWLERTEEGTDSVIMTNGFTPVTVSNNYIGTKLSQLRAAAGTLGDAIGMSYKLRNQEFYRITFPTADYTLEYNKTLNEWQCPLWWDWQSGQYHRHRANCITSAFDLLFAGDHETGEIYQFDPACYHDYGFPLRYNRRSPHVARENKRIVISRFELWMQTGVGLVQPLWLNDYSMDLATFTAAVTALLVAATITAQQALIMSNIYARNPYQTNIALPADTVMNPLGFYEWGRNPQITMKYSADGGKSFSNDMNRSLGRAGEDPAVYWDRLGAPKDLVIDLSGDDPCQLSISAAWIEAEALLS